MEPQNIDQATALKMDQQALLMASALVEFVLESKHRTDRFIKAKVQSNDGRKIDKSQVTDFMRYSFNMLLAMGDQVTRQIEETNVEEK